MFNRRNIAVNIRTPAAGINISNFTPDMTYHFPSICFSVKLPVPKRGRENRLHVATAISAASESARQMESLWLGAPSLAIPPRTCTTFSANLACGATIRTTNCRNGAYG